jgi:Sec-independent protein translocase protein TatA
MGVLEIVIISLIVILLFSIGRIPSIIQLLGRVLMSIRRSVLEGLIEDKDKQTEEKNQPKES